MKRLAFLFVFLFAVSSVAEEAKRVTADKERIIQTVRFLSEENHPRTVLPENKAKTIDYIIKAITAAGMEATRDDFTLNWEEGTFTNIHALKKGKTDKRIVVGAHFDAVHESPGANDNASGVAVLIELIYLFKEDTGLNHDIEFVFYDAEELGIWGSQRHARELRNQNVVVVCMLCIDMVGYYSDEEHSQTYPIDGMERLYGTTGDFLAVVGRMRDTGLVESAKKAFQEAVPLRIESFLAPQWFQFLFTVSDHSPFWRQGYPAMLFTDTANFRSEHLHQPTDTWDTLDYNRLAKVPVGIYHIILMLDAE